MGRADVQSPGGGAPRGQQPAARPAPAPAAAPVPPATAPAEGGGWPRRALLVSSSGGHLVQLMKLRDWWGARERRWVTFPGEDSASLLAGERQLTAFHPTTRNIPNALRNLLLAVRTLRSYRPDVVVSTGAGVAVPFFLVARLLGIRTVYLEVYDRIDLPTMSGRLCYPLADLFLLQWPEQQRFYRRGIVIGSVF